MGQPKVTQEELDGAVGVLPPSNGRPLAVVGPAASGPFATPAGFGRTKGLVSSFTRGPMVEGAAQFIEPYARPVVAVRTAASTEGSYLDAVEAQDGTISALNVDDFTGDSVPSVHVGSLPVAAFDVRILCVVGGTIGVAGVVLQYSLNGGTTWVVKALGTDAFIVLGASGVRIDFTADTINAGDLIVFTTTAPIPASAGEVTVDFGGSSIPTIDGTTHPDDDYDAYIEFVNGGTIGVDGITYKTSLDGGRTLSATTALGTATSIVIPASGGVKVDLGAGTINAGDNLAFPCVAPRWSNEELQAALTALRNTANDWEIAFICGPIDADAFDVIETAFAGMAAAGKYHAWIGHTRMPVGAETEADYLASLAAEFADKVSVYGMLCSGDCLTTSQVNGRRYRRPTAFVLAPKSQSVSEEVNIANPPGNALACSIRDVNGNPAHHDESVDPGLDAARFSVLRTWEGKSGVFSNRPRLFSGETSDFYLMPHRRVMNLARATAQEYFTDRLSKETLVDGTTGFILESEAKEMEDVCGSKLQQVLLKKPKASKVTISITRNENLLPRNAIMSGEIRVTSLAYPENILMRIGFENPVTNVVPV